jgi:hypothetical protein
MLQDAVTSCTYCTWTKYAGKRLRTHASIISRGCTKISAIIIYLSIRNSQNNKSLEKTVARDFVGHFSCMDDII